jgi:ParB-like chromosome segregation protein Spo0J
MAPTPNPALPDGVSPRIHEIISDEGFTYRVDYRHEMSEIRDDNTSRIQIRFETVPDKAHVRKLAEAAKAGAKLDLICITEDNFLAFGNHRFEAFKQNGVSLVPTIVLNVNAADADDETLRRLRVIGFRENAQSHLPNSKKTDEMAVVVLRADGWTNSDIARELGVAPGRVGEILAVDKGRKVLADLGITAPLTKTAVGALGRASEELNRLPFQEVAKLAGDALLNKTQINALAKAAKEAGDDADAVAIVQTERNSLGGRASGGVNRVTFAAQLRQRLGFINGKSGNPQVLVETNPASRDEHLRMVNEAIDVLTAVRDLQVAEAEDAAA